MFKYFFALVSALFMVACGNDNTTQKDTELVLDGDTIIIKENSPTFEQIKVQKAELQDFSAEFRTVGTVHPVAGKLAEIAPPFAGRIVKSHVKLGQKVNAGSTIFELSSTEYYEAVKNYFAAQSANDVAQRNYTRQKELATHGVASQKDLEQAQSEATIAQQEFEQAKASLQIFNINIAGISPAVWATHALPTQSLPASQSTIPTALPVQSPIAGEVVKYNITIGGYVKEDAEPLAVVADLSKVWVAALVKEKYFGAIKQGDRVEIYTDAHPNKIIWGTIYYIGEMLDEETRSLEVIVECNNADRELKLGMFCRADFLSAPTKEIILPATAVMQEQYNAFVMIEIEKGKYIRRKVEVETSLHIDEVRVVSGIAEGEKVVVEGGIFLNR